MAETNGPSPNAVAWLQQNPDRATDFDAKFGEGAASAALNPQQETSEDPSIAGDMFDGSIAGALDAVSETAQFLKDNIPTPAGLLDKASEAVGLGSVIPDEEDPEINLTDDLGLNRPVTTAGKITQGVTQFAVGFLGAGKITGIKNTFTGAMAKGFIADATAFDPYDGNLQNFLEANDWAIPVVSDALAVDPEDPSFVARLKNGADGLIAGAVLDTFIKGVKSVALLRKARETTDPAKQEALITEAEQLAEEAGTEGQLVEELGLPPEAPVKQIDEAAGAPTNEAISEAADVAAELVSPTKPNASYVDTDKLRLAVEGVNDVKHQYLRAADVDDLDSVLTQDWFNYSKMDGPVEAKAMIDTMGKALEDSGALAKFGLDQPEALTKTAAKASREVASMVGVGIGKFEKRLADLADTTVDQAKTVVAGKMVLQSLGREITQLATKIDNVSMAGKGQEELETKLIQLMENHASIQLHLKATQTAAARATSAGRIRTTDTLDSAAVEKLTKYGGSGAVRKLAKQLRSAGGPNQVSRLVRRATKRGALDVVNEYWINSILSGYTTHMVNMTSNAMNIALLPAERIAGGVYQGLRGQGFDEARAGLYQYMHMRTSVMDSVRLAGRALVEEGNVLDTATKLEITKEGNKAIQAETFGASSDSMTGKLINGVGIAARLPSRFLMAEDEFFKQLTFRSRLQADLAVASRKLDKAALQKLGYNNAGEFVEGEFEKAFTQAADLEADWQSLVATGRVSDEADLKEAFFKDNLGSANLNSQYATAALRQARAATFTTPLRQGSVSRKFQNMANAHPVIRQIAPFIQTPVNILTTARDRTPGLNLLFQEYRDRLRSDDPSIRAEAEGQMATGVAISSAVAFLALEGRVTGGGPTDPAKAAIWREDPNWQPYSINVGTAEEPVWVSYERLDPHGMLLGTVADVIEMAQLADQDADFDAGEAFAMIAIATANNLLSKTWFQGISDLVEVITSKDRPWVAKRILENKVASFMPYSSMGGQINRAVDPYMAEARSLTDKMKSKVPGYTSELATRYSWLTGKPVDNPSTALGYIKVKGEKRDPVGEELRKLGYGFGGPDRKIGGIELSSEQFQEWNRLMGGIKYRGKNLHQALEEVINSPEYDLGRERIPDGIGDASESHRVYALSKVMRGYKQAARAALMEGDPELGQAFREWKLFERRAKAGLAEDGERESLLLKF